MSRHSGKTRGSKPRSRRRRTTKIHDRSGQPLRLASMRDMAQHTGDVLRAASRHGTVAITRGGKPVAVMVSVEEFVAICVGFTTRAIKAKSLD